MNRKKTLRRKKAPNRKTSKDIAEKLLEDYADVFADIINVLCYDGAEIVQPEHLVDGSTESFYKTATEKYRLKRRDVVKLDKAQEVTLAVYGLENQTSVSNVMPVRVMGYDFASYDHCITQIKEQNKRNKRINYIQELWPEQKIPPTITLVLYFGMTPWDGPRTLHEMMDILPCSRPYIPDYKINLIQVAFLDEKTISKFKSDFRLAAEFFRAKRIGNTKQLMYNEAKIEHVEALLEFFHTFTGDARFRSIKAEVLQNVEKGEPVKMCDVVQSFVDEGMIKGKLEGRLEGRIEMLDKLIEKGFAKEKAMDLLDITAEEVVKYKEWKSTLV